MSQGLSDHVGGRRGRPGVRAGTWDVHPFPRAGSAAASTANRKGHPLTMTLVKPVSPKLRAAFVACHSEGHQWRHEGRIGGSDQGSRPPRGMTDSVGRVSVCTSCGSERVRWYSRTGEAFNRYTYPDGYTHRKEGPDDEPAPTRRWWREQLVVSLFADMTPTAKRKRAS